ncbi:20S proteasome subunit alpha 7 [Nematocida sp. AWRm80]|nr:20S proteasome subunit alpha 7 [Nematocida sp. AWRm80]
MSIEISGRYTETGNIVQIEYARKAASKGNTVLGIKYKDGVLLAVDKRSTSKLIDISECKHIESISDKYALGYSGVAHDFIVMKKIVKDHSDNVRLNKDRELLEEEILENIRHYMVYFTLHTGIRPFGCELLLISPSLLFHIDPSGAVNRCNSYAIGCNSQAAKTELEKTNTVEYSLDDAIQYAIRVLHISRDQLAENASEIEMVYISNDKHERVPLETIQAHSHEYK